MSAPSRLAYVMKKTLVGLLTVDVRLTDWTCLGGSVLIPVDRPAAGAGETCGGLNVVQTHQLMPLPTGITIG